MEYVIILLVISMMVGPILWLRPTPRERHISKLRTQAMSAGMSVTCPGVKRFKWAETNVLIEANRFVRYTLTFDDSQLSADDFRGSNAASFNGTYFRWIYKGNEEWQWHEVSGNKLDKIPELRALFEEIKGSSLGVVAIQLSYKSCSVYWHERGDETSVEQIKQYLQTLSQLIVADIKGTKS
ncbi:MAG: hypothetical protein KUG82_13155 [Pseudomonadales bacterium]|nr:hypothetical protein [Pseudomonadales bacterium]